MSMYKNVAVIVMLLALMALVPSAQANGASECDTVITGDTITLEGPEPGEGVDYYYLWTAVDEAGNTIASGTDRIFEFVAPEVTSISVSLLVTDGYGCIGSSEKCFTVIALPACGISGPNSVCEDSPVKEYIYVGEDTGTADFSFRWSVDNHEITGPAGEGETVTIDWSEKIGSYSIGFGDHVLTLVVEKTYPAGTATSTCEMDVKYVESPVATISVIV